MSNYKKCQHCGELFAVGTLQKRLKQVYCSKKCYCGASKKRVTVPCEICGKLVVRKTYKHKYQKHTFCSKKCQGKFREKDESIRKRPRNFICEFCGNEFVRKGGYIRKHSFCTHECYSRWALIPGNSSKWIGGKKKYQCLNCGVEFEKMPCWVKGKKTYCGDACKRSHIRGSEHHCWRGGISTEPYCQVWSDKEYKKEIMQRDGNKCQNPRCYKTGSRIVLHHINYDKKDCSFKNLITICNSCNSGANTNRDYHREYYSKILRNKYGY